MTLGEAKQLINNAPPISWAWLAGFFQAEGSIIQNGPAVYLQVADGNILRRIQAFLRANSVKVVLANNDGLRHPRLQTHHGNAGRLLSSIAPHLLTDKHEQACTALHTLTESAPLDWDVVTGFWEGDGSISQDLTYRLQFAQKNRDTLIAVRDFIGTGAIHQHNRQTNFGFDSGSVLTVSDPPSKLQYVKRLLEHTRGYTKRMKLVTILMCEGAL